MMRFGKTVFLTVVLSVGVLVEACTPSGPPSAPSSAPASPAPQASPTTASTPSPADIESTLTRIAQYDQRLKQLAADSPSPDDLVNTLQEILTLMDYTTTYYPQMTAQQRPQALGALTGILGDEVPVANTQARIFSATATAFAVAHPSPTTGPGTPTPLPVSPQATRAPATPGPTATVGSGTPTPNPVAGQIDADLEAIRAQTVSLASDQPTEQDIVGILGRLQADLSKLSQQSSSLPVSDMVSVLKSMDRAVAYLIPVVQTYTGRQNEAIATPTPPPTATSPTTSTPQATSTTSQTSTAAPTSTPGP